MGYLILPDVVGSNKRISSSATVSKLLPLQVENQLQSKIVLDLLRLVTLRPSSLASVSSMEIARLQEGENTTPGILAILDTRAMSTDPFDRPHPRDLLQSEGSDFPSVPLYPVWDSEASRSGLPDRVVPLYEMDKVLPRWMHRSVVEALERAGRSGTQPYMAVSSTPLTFSSGKGNAALELCKSLWRLRLYQGQGWAGEEPQVEQGLTVKGFEVLMEGKMHGRLS